MDKKKQTGSTGSNKIKTNKINRIAFGGMIKRIKKKN